LPSLLSTTEAAATGPGVVVSTLEAALDSVEEPARAEAWDFKIQTIISCKLGNDALYYFLYESHGSKHLRSKKRLYTRYFKDEKGLFLPALSQSFNSKFRDIIGRASNANAARQFCICSKDSIFV
jgi:hypothetical protein